MGLFAREKKRKEEKENAKSPDDLEGGVASPRIGGPLPHFHISDPSYMPSPSYRLKFANPLITFGWRCFDSKKGQSLRRVRSFNSNLHAGWEPIYIHVRDDDSHPRGGTTTPPPRPQHVS